MRSIHVAIEELGPALSSRRMRIALLGILIIPLLYGALYLWAFWDPYGRIDEIPVAVVNEDVAATVDGEVVAAGDDLVSQLTETGTLGWDVVDARRARTGVESGRYYMALTIPRGFSSAIASADSTSPVAATLLFTTHEASNMIANQIGDRVVSEVRAAASASASSNYYRNVFLGFSEARAGMKDAADGSARLHDGLVAAHGGAGRLSRGSTALSRGADDLSAGTRELADGASKLDTSSHALVAGTRALSSGLTDARAGASRLADGSEQAAQGSSALAQAAERVASGAGDLAKAATSADQGAARLAASSRAIADGVSGAKQDAGSLADAADSANAALQAYLAAHPEATQDADLARAAAAIEGVDRGTAALAQGLGTATDASNGLAGGASDLAAGVSALSKGATSLAHSTDAISRGAQGLVSATDRIAAGAGEMAHGVSGAASGAAKLSAGSRRLAGGARSLSDGLGSARDGAASLAAGAQSLSSGATRLEAGLAPAVTGSRELESGLTAGVVSLPDYTTGQQAVHATVMSDPVILEKERVDIVPNYGSGFAPYFIPLSLWIGALFTFFIVRPVPPQAIDRGLPAPVAALAGLWPAALLAVAQSIILLTVLHSSLGLEAQSLPLLFAFAALASVVFAAILQWLSTFGLPGKFVAIVLLMLQLTSAAGTYPLETLPRFFQVLSPWLPMTYVVAGLRQVISGGDWSALRSDALHLVAFGVVALLLMSVTAWRARSWPDERLHAKLEV